MIQFNNTYQILALVAAPFNKEQKVLSILSSLNPLKSNCERSLSWLQSLFRGLSGLSIKSNKNENRM